MPVNLKMSLAVLLSTAHGSVNACTFFNLPPIEKMVDVLPNKSVVIKGHVIQTFDILKQRPEIIRAEKIFIGDGAPRDFVIYRPKYYYDKSTILTSCHDPFFKTNQRFDTLVLVPARSSPSDDTTNGRWQISHYNSFLRQGRGLDLLVEKAKASGRFQSHPSDEITE